jgi:hypothetical protein
LLSVVAVFAGAITTAETKLPRPMRWSDPGSPSVAVSPTVEYSLSQSI